MEQARVEIAGEEMIVDYTFKITSPGYPATGPTFSSGGEPGAGPEFEIEVHGLRFPKQHADVVIDVPQWLKDLVTTYLLEDYDVGLKVADADRDPYYGRDPDAENDARRDDREFFADQDGFDD